MSAWIDELVSYYESGTISHKMWFSRKFNRLNAEQQEEIYKVLEGRGHQPRERKQFRPRKAPTKQRHERTAWTDEEWDKLTELVWNARKNNPTETLIILSNKVMGHFSADRRKNIVTSRQIEPLVQRIKVFDEQLAKENERLKADAAKIKEKSDQEINILKEQTGQLQQQIQQIPSRDEILGTLTDQEMMSHYGQRVLDNLSPDDILRSYSSEALLSYVPVLDTISYLFRFGVSAFAESQRELVNSVKELTEVVKNRPMTTPTTTSKPTMPMPRPQVQRLPRISVVGLLPDQQNKVEAKLRGRAQFNFVSKNRQDAAAVPDNQDIVLLAANFISHGIQNGIKNRISGTNTKLVVHHGGIDLLVKKLENLLETV